MEEENRHSESVHEHLEEVTRLLAKHRVVENLVERQEMPRHELVGSLVHKQNLNELQRKLDDLHPADVAYILEALPLDQRLVVWELVKAERDGEILLEVSDAVRETLIADMDIAELVAAAESLDTDEIADLAPDLPEHVVQEVLESLDAQDRGRLQQALTFPEDTVGAIMDFEVISVREDLNLAAVLRYLRRLDEFPNDSDTLFVVDKDEKLRGVLPVKRLLVNDPDVTVRAMMEREVVTFLPEDEAREAASAFERYDLISAPVVNSDDKLLGRITVTAVVDFIREKSDAEMLALAGLQEEEDIFSTVWQSAKNRWVWLATNLVTAIIASRVIGIFEGTIEKLVALATLMPIVAGIGGNSGNQTSTLIVRGMALGIIGKASVRRLVAKEIGVAVLNGILWGSILGFVAWLLYKSVPLALVMTSAMLLNLVVAALAGIFIPMLVEKSGRDPALGSSVLLTFTTDSMGFFIFLGLATIFLL
ncbi:MAG: magnesium transporter [Burkholderiales bacterium]